MSRSAMPRRSRRRRRCSRASAAAGALMCRSCKAASIISSPPAAANCSIAPDKAASTCSFSRAARSAAMAPSISSASATHDHPSVRFPGSFGSGYLYYVVPKVILFRLEHSRRTLVPKVDFVSAPGTSPDNVYRTGGPIALVTNRCVFSFDKSEKAIPARQRASRPHARRSARRNRIRFRHAGRMSAKRPRRTRRHLAPDARARGAGARRGLSGIHRENFQHPSLENACHHIHHAPFARVEDEALITGRGRYIADAPQPGMLYAAFVRSPHAAARIVSVDIAQAKSVARRDRGADRRRYRESRHRQHFQPSAGSGRADGKPLAMPYRPTLAGERVSHVGEPVVAVIAAERACGARRRRAGQCRIRSRCPRSRMCATR